ncbi:ATP-binding cassette domain-containing protein [bacterium]|nr:ATP-binding cassette domain-containing protein [bacterium]
MIKFQNISKIYHSSKTPVVALKDVSFEIKQGEFVSIVGKSGAGKTTLVKLLISEEKPSRGEIFFKGKKIGEMCPADIQYLRKRIGVVHQDYKLLTSKNVKENVEYIMQVIGASDKDISRDVPQVLEMVGLLDRQTNFPEELSGGEKQRLAIARALIHRPEVIVADEPTGNLDLYNTFEIINLLKKIHGLGTTIILATHNREIIERLGHRVITLEKGKIIRDDQEGKFIL